MCIGTCKAQTFNFGCNEIEPLTGKIIDPLFGLLVIPDIPGQQVSIVDVYYGRSTFAFYTSNETGNGASFYEYRSIVDSNGTSNGYKYYYINNYCHDHDVIVDGIKYRSQFEAGKVVYFDSDFSDIELNFPSKSTINNMFSDEIPFDLYTILKEETNRAQADNTGTEYQLNYQRGWRVDLLSYFTGIAYYGIDGQGNAPGDYFYKNTNCYVDTKLNLSWSEIMYVNLGKYDHDDYRYGVTFSTKNTDLVGAVNPVPYIVADSDSQGFTHDGNPIELNTEIVSHGLFTLLNTTSNTVEVSYDIEQWNTVVDWSEWEELWTRTGLDGINYYYAFANTTNGQSKGGIRIRINNDDNLIYYIDTILPGRYYHFDYAD